MRIIGSFVSCGVFELDGLSLASFKSALAYPIIAEKLVEAHEKWDDKLQDLLDKRDSEPNGSGGWNKVTAAIQSHLETEPDDPYQTSFEDDTDIGDYGGFYKDYTYIFSDNKSGSGALIAQYIKQNRLGSLVSTNWAVNPNSGNKIKTWVWTFNGRVPKALKASA
jgi:hypothetical protein